ncbi:Lrp/AsnC family transcriptional regulator [Intrasporangium calvum]|uniref:Transcriptional regulator, AsnC family n=1 Tax=Intrasporangium calvum (strain ATCC 23552 / DSM 43043 / JCM 3097 / NBRC 12989 / NCIMB 10167 / NRRL B-3866 / 7 KIP) TaxID=710696 RepID=E6SFG2_INTC7|nr:Lrp/AsnC family transcriptional regulator [Intrasporangium calvum]ADU46700.1 transcriptional regulator, AsnC family [Intrasporangium calvum DSM 43043]
MMGAVDRVDWHILSELQADARLSFNELSRRVKLSAPAVADRVRRLEEAGVIVGYHAQVDLERAGRPVRAVVVMDCYGPTCLLRDPEVAAWPEVQELYRVTGPGCSVLVVATASMDAFEDLIDRLARYGRPSSSMILADQLPWSPVQPVPSP